LVTPPRVSASYYSRQMPTGQRLATDDIVEAMMRVDEVLARRAAGKASDG
jgi:hypothetical protein